jgi:hypothetical protein
MQKIMVPIGHSSVPASAHLNVKIELKLFLVNRMGI